MNCSKCNALIPDDSAFCPECGAKAEPVWTAPSEPAAQVFCPNCGAAMAAGDSFCENCGAKVEAAPQQEAPAPKAGKKSKAGGIFDSLSSKTKIPAKFLKLGVAAVALILVVAIVVSIFAAGAKPNFALYKKDGALMYSKLSSAKPAEITDEYTSTYWMSKDGKKLFYLEDSKLYYVDVTKKNAEPKKLQSDVDSYKITEDGSKVFYMKKGDLRWCDLKDNSEKIASDVGSFWMTDNGKTLIYTVNKEAENPEEESKVDLYRATVSGKKVTATKIETGTEIELENLSDNGKTVVYVADGDLYIQTGKKEAEKIAADAAVVGKVYDNGAFYYRVRKEVEKENDYGTYKDYEVTLHYYDGKKSNEVTKDYYSWEDYAADAAVLAFYNTEEKETDEGVKIEHTYYIAVKGKVSEVKLDDVSAISLKANGKEALILTDRDEETRVGTLYKASIGSAVKDPKKVNVEDVYMATYTPDGKKTVYYTDPSKENNTYTLYVNGKKIADDVAGVDYNEESGMMIYITDASEKDQTFTLWSVKGSKGKKIDDDVHDIRFTPDGTLLYLADMDDGEGTLYRSTGGAGKVVDTDVSSICYVNTFTD